MKGSLVSEESCVGFEFAESRHSGIGAAEDVAGAAASYTSSYLTMLTDSVPFNSHQKYPPASASPDTIAAEFSMV